MAAHLPNDMMTEILLRLPVICLLKCLCVCKDWYGLIKSPAFVDRHFNHPSSHRNRSDDFIVVSGRRTNPGLSYNCLDNINGTLLHVPMQPVPHSDPGVFSMRLMLSGPCNGIFCAIEKAIPTDYVFLCNPATRESRRLPERPSRRPPAKRRSCEGISAFGLGVDLITNEYKVVAVLTYRDQTWEELSVAYRIGVYSLSSNSWREVETTLPASMRAEGSDYYMDIWNGGGLYFNGRLHWGDMILDDLDIILSFDLTNEVTGHLPLPPNAVPANMGERNYWTVMVLEDRIAVAAVATPADGSEACSIFVWKMMDYGAAESWMMRFSISIPLAGGDLHPLCFWKDQTLLLLERSRSELVSVDNAKEDGWSVKSQKIANIEAVNALVLVKESLVPLH